MIKKMLSGVMLGTMGTMGTDIDIDIDIIDTDIDIIMSSIVPNLYPIVPKLGPDSGVVGTENSGVRQHSDYGRQHSDYGRKREIGDKINMEKDNSGNAQYPRSKDSELQEAHNHLEYFKRHGKALDGAIGMMLVDVAICRKEVKTWEGRIEKLEGKA